MENEKNQTLEGLQLHEVIVLNRNQKTAEDGKKKGYSWKAEGEIGVITQLSKERMVITKPDLETEAYSPAEDDENYYYTIDRGSEIEFSKKIDEQGIKEQKVRDESQEKIMQLKKWKHDFEYSISFIGKMARFIKSFRD